MPTKTERILGYLPLTFQAASGRSALRAIAAAFGGELQSAENSLAALMRAHWVDHADKGAEEIDDLRRLASLYGLAPRADETVEEFREHLKRYVRTFLDGTVTVRGILRVTAEALGLDLDEDMEFWWNRPDETVVDRELRRDDGARVLFGFEAAEAAGEPAHPARMTGLPDLSGGADLRQAWLLRVGLDGATPITVDLKAGASDPARVTLDHIAAAITAALGPGVAHHDGHFLTLESPTPGPGSRLELVEGLGDAAGPVLGLPPFRISGREPRAARVTGTVDLTAGANLAAERFLRISIGHSGVFQVREVDCAGASPAATTLDEIRGALNAAFGFPVASHDGRFLTLASDGFGGAATLAFEEPAAGNARERLFGDVPTFHTGRDAEPARFTGTRDVSHGIDLAFDSEIVMGIDGQAPVTVDCAGASPPHTLAQEIAASLNTALGAEIVRVEGRFLTITSPTAGSASEIAFLPAPSGDATQEIFGLHPRVFRGTAATPARVHGVRELETADVRARHLLGLAVDGGAPRVIDLREGMADPGQASLDELVAVINTAAGAEVASHDGRQISLTSTTAGAGSRLSVQPLETVRRRRFVTRATLADEASRALFGFVSRQARGEDPTSARVVGKPDLSHGIDLRPGRYLRIALDGQPARDVDCAGPRPRATLLTEVVEKINAAFPVPEKTPPFATHDGRRLILLSSAAGRESRIAFEPPRNADALDPLGLPAGTVRGKAARGVRLLGTVDLAEGVDLPAGAAVRLGIDGAAPIEIALPAGHRGLPEVVLAINLALGMDAARHDGIRLSLLSPTSGAAGRLTFAVPAGTDATELLFGFKAPRAYRGADAEPARLAGTLNLSGGADLSTARTLRVAVDGGPSRDVDASAGAASPASAQLSEIVVAINSALGADVASHEGGRLVLTSPTSGPAGSLKVEHHGLGDARSILFGDVPAETRGEAAKPAVIEGEADLLGPADLDRRRRLRVSVDGGRPVEVDVSGAAPRQTFLDEVVDALNAAVPDLASATPDDRLRLTSPTRGSASRLDLLPLRFLELQEYAPTTVEVARQARHGESVSVVNRGAAASPLEIEILAPHGSSRPGLVNAGAGVEVRLDAALSAGDRALLSIDPDTSAATARITGLDGAVRSAPVRLAGSLVLPRGRTEWVFLEGSGARFDQARFDEDRFAGEDSEVGLFDVSRFGEALFGPVPSPAVELTLRWESHRPGTFVVNLPAELPARFGGRFNEARFGTVALAPTDPPTLAGVVTEPPDDPSGLVMHIEGNLEKGLVPSPLVRAQWVARVPIGFEAVKLPFRKPRNLRLGTEQKPAAIYLAEDGLEGFIEIRARQAGTWGNDILVSARPAGPGLWDVNIEFPGVPFESGRRTALGAPLPPLAQNLLKPGPIGILQAKAAGVEARVTRDRAEP
ncbi:MAG: hypothetical protein ABUT39_19305 [Acidobacteriota bacterium]